MFGKNKPMAPRHDKDTFLVKSIFPTIQGEGPFAGQPALFLRLAGCNLRCTFCDTDFDEKDVEERTAEQVAIVIDFMRSQVKTDLLVITGGEPMLQNLPLLIAYIWTNIPEIKRVQIETAGTVWPPGLEKVMFRRSAGQHDNITGNVYIVISPKTPTINKHVRPYVHAWKYIINAENASPTDGLPMLTTQPVGRANVDLARPCGSRAPVYVQPMDEQSHFKTQENMEVCVKLAMDFGYRISLQTHKILKVE